jgi:Ran GTPase-activating protein (RanGAP) involved in mRNA processing and transport
MTPRDLAALFGLKTLRHLRVLQVYHIEHRYPLELLARNASLGGLTHLWLRPHGLGCSVPPSGAYVDLDGVRAVLRSTQLKGLTHLRLQLCNMGDEGCAEIIRSGILKRLKVLELQYGEITDEGARLLAGSADLRNLERLDVSQNSLTAAGRAALEAVPIQVRADGQFGPDQEGEYLGYGDME